MFLLAISFKIHVINFIAIVRISFLKMGIQQKCRKKTIEIFNEKPRRLQNTIARLAGVN